ncbi:hypothetical protein LCGC14_1209650 [marine sediment metagenome]|uniref:Uncharacterized protein n=1 Tax=marine sediment metagenome TaxID=412755 RepID=A0A0F9LIR1_9ZZZZ
MEVPQSKYLKVSVCKGCGVHWAWPEWEEEYLCPPCQVDEFQKMQEEAGRDYDLIHHGSAEVGLTDG